MNVVIGSGPAGVACADALRSCGEPVTILDAGLTLEAERRVAVDHLAEQPVAGWSASDLQRLRGDVRPDAKGLLRKLVYGSDFPYRQPQVAGRLRAADAALVPSYAQGGLSNVWGASLLPYKADEFAEWPISRDDLAPYYREALEMMPVSAVVDDLAEEFPLFGAPDGALDPGRQGRAILEHLKQNGTRLAARGIRYGRARLGVQVDLTPERPGCVYCGQCLAGCPFGLIYNAADTLDALRNDGVTYEAGRIVEEVAEEGDQAIVRGRTLEGDAFEHRADRVFLAAGVLNSTRIMLRSMARYDDPVRILDSSYFLLPLLGKWTSGDRYHTLSQSFLEIDDPAVAPRRVHLQLYGYNELYGEAVDAALGPIASLLRPVVRPLKHRLLAIQGYLHSDLSPGMSVRLRKEAGGETLEVIAEAAGGHGQRWITAVGRLLAKNARVLGAVPLLPLLRSGEPGRGFHSGGSFPMSRDPGADACDRLGRPSGLSRVHVVDSTVLPSIPAGPITLTVMANARRIARETIGSGL